MKKEDKQLLFKDLSARLPYNVIVEYGRKYEGKDLGETKSKLTGRMIDSFFGSMLIGMTEVYSLQPYLRPLSSMTEEEMDEWETYVIPTDILCTEGLKAAILYEDLSEAIDWLNAHHFDYRGLIERGLALPAPEGMYNLNKDE